MYEYQFKTPKLSIRLWIVNPQGRALPEAVVMANVIDLSLDSGGEDEGAVAVASGTAAASASVDALVTVFASVTACTDLARARTIVRGSISRGLGIEHAIAHFYNTGGVGGGVETAVTSARASAKRSNLTGSGSTKSDVDAPPVKRARASAAKAKAKAKSKKRKSPASTAASSVQSPSSSAAPVSRPAPFAVSVSRSDFMAECANGVDARDNECSATAHDAQVVERQREKIVADVFNGGRIELNLEKVNRGKKERTDASKNPSFKWVAKSWNGEYMSSSFASGMAEEAFVELLQKRYTSGKGVGEVPADWSKKAWSKYALASQRRVYEVCVASCKSLNDSELESATDAAAAKLIKRVAAGRGLLCEVDLTMSWTDSPLRPFLSKGAELASAHMALGELLSHGRFVPLWEGLDSKAMLARVHPPIAEETRNVFDICVLQPVFRTCLAACTTPVSAGHGADLTINGKRMPSALEALASIAGRSAGDRRLSLFSGPAVQNPYGSREKMVESAQWYAVRQLEGEIDYAVLSNINVDSVKQLRKTLRLRWSAPVSATAHEYIKQRVYNDLAVHLLRSCGFFVPRAPEPDGGSIRCVVHFFYLLLLLLIIYSVCICLASAAAAAAAAPRRRRRRRP